MGKKKNSESKQQPQNENPQEQPIEGKFLLGKPKFKKLENGRYKCVQTGHELPADARESYAQTKHCRLGLIDYALARNKPPLNMFNQDPLCRSKLICKLTGDTVNKTEEHIWKHINGKRFLNMLEKEEAEAEAGKESSNDLVEEEGEQKPEKAPKSEEDVKKKKKKKKKNKKKKEKESDVSKIISEVRNPEEHDSVAEEEDFWMPPEGDRWDFDDGKDRWGSDLESDIDPENDDAGETDVVGEETQESNETQELFKRTKRMSIELEPSDLGSKKKTKIQST
ncbi:hypothetical protein SSX86_008939 [Deinandra increscens subsp. villosa]|uniref:Surfeit locus protein 2 n=1 Tax=Deinandra increscens subsp. villosa TaxID=3103831 RepID=A0AAP0DCA3_9ASTR